MVILAWSSEKLLPGHPLLEACLNATSSGIAPFVQGTKPESHFSRALGWFRDAGLEKRPARTFVGDAPAPLADDLRRALIALFQMRCFIAIRLQQNRLFAVIPEPLIYLVELAGIEPAASSMPRKRAPSAPQPHFSVNDFNYR